jgi:hypothetical protein
MGNAASFNPLSLSPALWLDASDAATLFQSNGGAAATADGDPVGYWMDKSGNGLHFAQTDPIKKPLLKTAIKNGKNVVRLDGVNDYLINNTLSSSVTSLWIFAAFRVGAATTQYVWDTNASGVYRPILLYDGGNCNWQGNYKTRAVNETVIFGINYKANPNIVYANGSQVTGLSGTATTPGATTGMVLGTYYSQSVFFMGGDFYEIIRFHGSLTTQNKDDLFTYLNSKWGVY